MKWWQYCGTIYSKSGEIIISSTTFSNATCHGHIFYNYAEHICVRYNGAKFSSAFFECSNNIGIDFMLICNAYPYDGHAPQSASAVLMDVDTIYGHRKQHTPTNYMPCTTKSISAARAHRNRCVAVFVHTRARTLLSWAVLPCCPGRLPIITKQTDHGSGYRVTMLASHNYGHVHARRMYTHTHTTGDACASCTLPTSGVT